MTMTKVFNNGNSQAVRIPAEYRVEESELVVQKLGSTLIMYPKEDVWKVFQSGLDSFTDDFIIEREQPEMQERPGLDLFDEV